MSDPRYPDVPDTKGVPPVLRDGPSQSVPQLTADQLNNGQPMLATWGIYTTGGAKALDADSVVSLEYMSEFRVADYPLEKGGFVSYDKVAMPFDIRTLVTKGGSIAERTSFLSAVERLKESLDLVNVVTPERTYLNVNLVRASLSRSATGGAGLIAIECGFREIRESATANYSNSKQPSGAAQVIGGSVQVTPAPDGFAPVLEPEPSTFDPATGGGA